MFVWVTSGAYEALGLASRPKWFNPKWAVCLCAPYGETMQRPEREHRRFLIPERGTLSHSRVTAARGRSAGRHWCPLEHGSGARRIHFLSCRTTEPTSWDRSSSRSGSGRTLLPSRCLELKSGITCWSSRVL